MPDVLVRDLSDRALELLKDQARSRGRSLQAELKHILEQAAQAGDVAAALAIVRTRSHLRALMSAPIDRANAGG